jgi:hypothetical protein
MKIGFSYSRCVKDIVNGVVNIDDVLVLITRTDFDPNNDEQWAGIWKGYRFGSNPEWYGCSDADEARYRDLTIQLWNDGKLHQPRKFGAWPIRTQEYWVDCGPLGYELYQKPDAVKEAWRNYQILSQLTIS